MYYCHPNLPIGVDVHCGGMYFRISPRMVGLTLDLIAERYEGGEAGSQFPELQSFFYRDHYSSRAARRLRIELDRVLLAQNLPAPAAGIAGILHRVANESARSGEWILLCHTG
jgi:hypothetical protein